MRFEDVCKVLAAARLVVFSLEDICAFFPGEKTVAVNQCLSRWKKNGWLVSLRRGLYELVFPEQRAISDMYLANRIYAPSYVSLETALSRHSMIPEVSMAVMSVTSKATRRFKNPHGLFIYRSVQPRAFCGYRVESHDGLEVLVAEPEKALVDWLYFASQESKKPQLGRLLRLDHKKKAGLDSKKLAFYGSLYGIDPRSMLHAFV